MRAFFFDYIYVMRILLLLLIFPYLSFSQIVINEGCNKNFSAQLDENNSANDWIELFNNSDSSTAIEHFSLSDELGQPLKWELPPLVLGPHAYKIIYCSGKDRKGSAPFVPGSMLTNFQATPGWNTHPILNVFNWDGSSNIVINVCAYNNSQYTLNSIFKQSVTTYASTQAVFIDGSPAACQANTGQLYYQRPNLRINNKIIDSGTLQNGTTSYPAPYGNWYWGSRHQILVRANELHQAGIQAGPINQIAFEVVNNSGDTYTYVKVDITQTAIDELTGDFLPENGFLLHTNFKINPSGETVYLFNPIQELVSQLEVKSPVKDISVGRSPNGNGPISWMIPTPGAQNNGVTFMDTLKQPVLSKTSGNYQQGFYLKVYNPNNSASSKVVYTTDASSPTSTSNIFPDSIFISSNKVIRLAVFPIENVAFLPSKIVSGTYLFSANHSTPILLVTTDQSNLYGSTGIFDNFTSEEKKPAHVAYLSEGQNHPLLFESLTAMRMDGGAGGSRSQPQHSFRLSFNDGVLGEKKIDFNIQPLKPERKLYSDFYLRNGSNQYLKLPYKDACQVYMMTRGTHVYYSGYRPVSVYINGDYFGLYELREKFNHEFFNVYDGANPDSTEILTLSYYYGSVLRALSGSTDGFYESYDSLVHLSPSDSDYFERADNYFDMKQYTDYIIAESWMGNTDWPQNNIKMYRSNKTKYRWQFALIDLELSLQPNGWTSCTDNHISYLLSRDPNIPYINIWLRSMQNPMYKNYFINRFADQINTNYQTSKLLAIENSFYQEVVNEMPQEYLRWGDPNNIQGQMADFQNNHTVFREQLACRNEVVRGNLVSEFGLNKQVNVKLDVFPTNAGSIQLNSITPDSLPWQGIYFDGVPIHLTANAKTGYSFSHWEPNNIITDTLATDVEVNVEQTNTLFKAIFTKKPIAPDGPTVHFSIYPSPASEFITLSHNNLSLTQNCEIQIFDINGKYIKSSFFEVNSFTKSIDISELAASFYIIRFKKNNELLGSLRFFKR